MTLHIHLWIKPSQRYYIALVKASVELAHEYIKLGKTERAATVFGRALAFGRNPAHKLSDEIRIMFLLRYAESLAIVSNTEKRYDRNSSLCRIC